MVHKKTALIVGFIVISAATILLTTARCQAQSKPGGAPTSGPAFPSAEECQNATGMVCDLMMCDYIPEGQTYEETCGKDFQKGWQATQTPFTGQATPVGSSSFDSQSACESATGRSCGYAMCDYVPEGQTFEEICGKNFKEGWQPK